MIKSNLLKSYLSAMAEKSPIDAFAVPRDFAVYQNFNRREDMAETVDVLRDNRIAVRVSGEDAGEWTESVIMGSPLKPEFWIEIPSSDFEKANFVLLDYAEANLTEEEIDAHPFAEYSPEELRQVLLEDTGWSPLAIAVARKLLLRTGEEVDLTELRREARERVRVAFTPKKGSFIAILATVLLGVFSGVVLWFIGFMLALGILLYFAFGTLRDPEGQTHPAFTKATHNIGKTGLMIILVAALLGLLNFLYFHIADFSKFQEWLWFWP